jgi:sec-independent protein translocase protein TatC
MILLYLIALGIAWIHDRRKDRRLAAELKGVI